MSKIGRQIIRIPENIELIQDLNFIFIKSGKFLEKLQIPEGLFLEIDKEKVKIKNISEHDSCVSKSIIYKKDKVLTSMWGTFKKNLQNKIVGVSQGFQITLKLTGIGYKASLNLEKNELILKLGFSHVISLQIPSFITIVIIKSNIIMRSHQLDALMQYAALVRSYKVPEPYKGKGILYKGEKIRRKEGKKNKKNGEKI